MKMKNKVLFWTIVGGLVKIHDDRIKQMDDMKIVVKDDMCDVTKKVVEDFNMMSNKHFMAKYQCSKLKYRKRVRKYGDPYMNGPLAKLGRFLGRKSVRPY